MYINPFWAGVGVTLLLEFIIVLIVGLFAAMRSASDDDDREGRG